MLYPIFGLTPLLPYNVLFLFFQYILMYILSYMCIVPPAFFSFLFIWKTPPSFHFQSVCYFRSEVFCRLHICVFFIHSLGYLIGTFSLLIFIEVIDRYVLIALLLIGFCLFFYSFVPFVFLAFSLMVCYFSLVLYLGFLLFIFCVYIVGFWFVVTVRLIYINLCKQFILAIYFKLINV